ncbi:unnamed protein product [Fusarium graminearum]|uniref:Uncharacterized protein n=1 Tax=Gibberella zeae TaxID=5518 RepID=A0A4E9EIW4_GIBZA|nr:unnamed protein product [Fusarium graminearum]
MQRISIVRNDETNQEKRVPFKATKMVTAVGMTLVMIPFNKTLGESDFRIGRLSSTLIMEKYEKYCSTGSKGLQHAVMRTSQIKENMNCNIERRSEDIKL